MRDLVEKIVDLTTDHKMSSMVRLVEIGKLGRTLLAQLDEVPAKQRTAKEKAGKDGPGDPVQNQNPPPVGAVVL